MKRSEINRLFEEASAAFANHGWALPPNPKWDITDFGLENLKQFGLVLVNLADEPEYCEKLMYAREGMRTPWHTHRIKKEDIICRHGRLAIALERRPGDEITQSSIFKRNGVPVSLTEPELLFLSAGERVTLFPGIFHEFYPVDGPCIIGEVSTANDDVNDNVFLNAAVGRFSQIEEDEMPAVRLVNENG